MTSGTIARQAPLSMEFSRQEYWSGLPFPSPGDLPNPGIQPASPVLAGGFFTTELPGKSLIKVIVCVSHAVVSDSLQSYGEGSGTPLQYSCLENPMDGGAW